MKKMLDGEPKKNHGDSTQTSMNNNLFDIYQQKLNIVIKMTTGHCLH